ncbi:MAG: cell division protein ZapA [Lachnospiraceae bacterium]|nr:cell division protein ZapA [Lachnospiraceae bacterium]
MAEKNYTEINLMGKSYILGGAENESYLQRIATYVNGKHAELAKTQGFLRKNSDYRYLMLIMNVADDYFKAQTRLEDMGKRLEALEQELYSVKHDLVASRIRHDEA